jgi:hypothetical protein
VLWLAAALTALIGAIGMSALPAGPRAKEGNAASATWWLAVAAIAALGAALRLWIASRLPLASDEYSSWGFTSLWQEMANPDLRVNPPLYRILAWPVAALSEGAPRAGRIASIALSLPTCLALAALARRWGGASAGLLAALLAVLHPGLVLVGTVHRAYGALLALGALLLWSTERALSSGLARHRYAAALFAVCVVITHWFGAFFVAGVGLWLLTDRRRGALRAWHGPFEVAALLLAFFVPLAIGGGSDKVASVNAAVGAEHARAVLAALLPVVGGTITPELQGSAGEGAAPLRLVLGGALTVALVAFAAWRARGRMPVGAWLGVALVAATPPVLMAGFVTGIREVQLLSAALPLIIIVAVGLGEGRRARSARAMVAVIALAGMGWVTAGYLGRTAPLQPERELAAYVAAHEERTPIYVWEWDDFTSAAVEVGLSAEVAYRAVEGADPRLRALRSCSTAAVREAASRTQGGSEVWLAIMPDTHGWAVDDPHHHPCDAERLTGRGARCDAVEELAEGGAILRCVVELPASIDIHALWP